jgi:ABC-type sugar transport system ATPase subunit
MTEDRPPPARIYDVTEGTIRINGRDIRELKLDDLRRSIAVLFQDYTLFPISVCPSISTSYAISENMFPPRLRTISRSVTPNMPLTLSSSMRLPVSEAQTL